MRHDRIRNLEAEFLREVCTDVKVEPQLLPLVNLELNGTNADKARLDQARSQRIGFSITFGYRRTNTLVGFENSIKFVKMLISIPMETFQNKCVAREED